MEPVYCPFCGVGITDVEQYWVNFQQNTNTDGRMLGEGIGYDIYCDACGKSGIVEPDDEMYEREC